MDTKPESMEPSKEEFGADRTQRCIELMRPEVRALIDLPLDQKVKKTEEIIKEAIKKYKNPGIGFSGGADSEVMLHIAMKIKHDWPILFVDTMYEFPETYGFIEKIREEWNFESFTTMRPGSDKLEEFKQKYGMGTPEFTIEFNKWHKIDPLMRGIKQLGLDVFLGGIRGVEHEERAKESIFSHRENPPHDRCHPIIFWQSKDVKDYLKINKIPYHPKYNEGYTSLGLTVDTSPTKPGMHERSGRGVTRERNMKKLRELGYN